MVNFRLPGLENQNQTTPIELHNKTATSQTVDTAQTRQISNIFKENLSFINSFVGRIKENETCENHVVGMRHTASKIKNVASSFFRKLVELTQKGVSQLADTRVARKLKDMYEYLNSCDFTFVRHSEDPILKDVNQQIVENLIKLYHEFEKKKAKQSVEESIHSLLDILKVIGALEFPPTEYMVRNAMVCEILTKHLAPLALKTGLQIPIPCFKDKKTIVSTYQIVDILTMGSTQIPVYALYADDKSLPPLIVFRGTVLNLSDTADATSIVENMNKIGPARKAYDDFKKPLGLYLKKMAKDYPLFRFLGYSQGGVLAARACVDYHQYLQKDELNSSILFNPPGLEADYCSHWELLSKKDQPAVVTYLVTRDIVSKRGHKFIGEIYEIQPPTDALLHSHLGAKFLNPNWHLFVIDNEKESESPTRKLVNQLMSSSLVQGIYKIASKRMENRRTVTKNKDLSARTLP